MKRSWLVSLLLLLGIAAGSYIAFLALRPDALPHGIVYGNGHIEGIEVRVAAEVPGRVVEHALVEGQTVTAGQPLVAIDPRSFHDELAAMRGELAALHGTQAAIDAQIVTWTHHAESAQRQSGRLRRLADDRVAAAQELDRALDTEREAVGQIERLRAQRETLAAQIDSVASRVRLAETQVERSTVLAPLDATVLVRAVEVGEVVQAGQPLALLVDLARLELKVYLPGVEAGKVRPDAPARVQVDAWPGRVFDARVARLDAYAQFAPRDIHLPEERTRMVYGVVLALDNPDGALKPGMPADAWIRWDETEPWPERLFVPRD
ncbi:MAG TPA: efflux RND transporter periplasmic adaptor subunit [Xanthomonadaceae bacterium]|nr:efflux RND transporter periplasmic adaptor subunit [Xanthomonadaceae bacterium]